MPELSKNPDMDIAGRKVGVDHPPFIIAEMSGNHNGNIDRALEIIRLAAEVGADAVKIQTYTADTITLDHISPDFLIKKGPWKNRSLYDLYSEAQLPWEWHADLFEYARELGIIIFSSPFDFTAVDFLETLDCPAYKIASFECIDTPLIGKAARTNKPLIISTGLANQTEIQQAVKSAMDENCTDLALLHCTSAYPADQEDYNLRTLSYLKESYSALVGLSDHTLGTATAIASVALGASIVEKHFTISRSDGGPDASFSMEPSEFTLLVEECHSAWKSLGSVRTGPVGKETENLQFRRSLYVVKDIKAGELFGDDNIKSIRPGFGLAPIEFNKVKGAYAKHDIPKGTALKWNMLLEKEV